MCEESSVFVITKLNVLENFEGKLLKRFLWIKWIDCKRLRGKVVNFRKVVGVFFREVKLKLWILFCGLCEKYKMKVRLVGLYLKKKFVVWGMIVYL